MTKKSRIASAALAVAALTALAGCAAGGGGDDGTLVYVSYGGAFQDAQAEAWQEGFSAETGTVFENTSPSDMAQIRAMVDAGATSWDVVDTNAYFPNQFCGEYFEEIDLSDIDTSQFEEGSVSDCAVPAERFALLLVYNADTYGDNPPTSLADYLDTENFPGQRASTREVSTGLLESILIADGVAADELYPLDLDRAFAALDTIRSQTTFAENNGALQQLVTDGQADMALVVSARALTIARDDVAIEPVWGTTVTTFNSLTIPKGAPNIEGAQRFIAYATQPEQSAKFAELSGTSPANLDAEPAYDDLAEKFNAFADGRTTTVQLDAQWWSENVADVQNRFTTWLAG
jgi:putative spermidine/putrescine transport system substrate-binding protein